MKKISKNMIKRYNLDILKFDFMGYTFSEVSDLSFHHLIIPHRLCRGEDFNGGYFDWNGVMLSKTTAHTYLHLIEKYDLDRFIAITSEMVDENFKGYLDYENLKRIDDILNGFEREQSGVVNINGNEIIKEEYTRRLLKK